MDVLIPYKHTQSDELFWAIKSLKNVEHGTIYVIGDEPPLNVKGIEYIPKRRVAGPDHYDQIQKYEYGAFDASVSEKILLMNDDMFIMEDWFPQNYNRGTLDEHINSRRMDSYTRFLKSTKEFLESKNMMTISYEVHTPMLVEKSKLLEAIYELHGVEGRSDVMIRSYYGNRFGIESTRIEDPKNPKDYEGKSILSTNDTTFKGPLGKYIKDNL